MAGGVLLFCLGTQPACRQFNKISGSNDKQELLEAELRTREREILELRSEVENLRQLTGLYQRNGLPAPHDIISGPVLGGGPVLMPYPGQTTSQKTSLVRELTLGTGTGGRDDDGLPGDEILQVVIVPKDDVGTEIKIPGKAIISAQEITREGLKRAIGQWEVTPEQLKRAWKGGLLGSGYFVPLQWDQPPTNEKVRISVRFTTTDGGTFEADKDINLKLLPGLQPRPVVLPAQPITELNPTGLPPLGQPLEAKPKAKTNDAIPTVPAPSMDLGQPSELLPLPEFPIQTTPRR